MPVKTQVTLLRKIATPGFSLIMLVLVSTISADTPSANRGAVTVPAVTYSSVFGGSSNDSISASAIAPNGDRIVCGATASSDLPVVNALDTTFGGVAQIDSDIFVARIEATTDEFVFLTYLGGSAYDFCTAAAVDSLGNIIVGGMSHSTDYPLVNAFDGVNDNTATVFGSPVVTKFSPTGDTIIFSTFLSGADLDVNDGVTRLIGRSYLSQIIIDPTDESIVVAGMTGALDFPVTHQIDSRQCLDGDTSTENFLVADAYISRITALGALDFSACLGGNEYDWGRAIALNASGDFVVAVGTRSSDYPVTAGAVSISNASEFTHDLAVSIVDASSYSVVSSARIGGTYVTVPQALAIGPDQDIVVVGYTDALDLPATSGAFQETSGTVFSGDEPYDGFVTKLSPALDQLRFLSYLGGAADDYLTDINIDEFNQIWVLGRTESVELPQQHPLQGAKGQDLLRPVEFAQLAATASSYTDYYLRNIPGAIDLRVSWIGTDGPNLIYDLYSQDHPQSLGTFGNGDTRAMAAAEIGASIGVVLFEGNYQSQSSLYAGLELDAAGAVVMGTPIPVGVPEPTVTATIRGPSILVGNYQAANTRHQIEADLSITTSAFGDPLGATLFFVNTQYGLLEIAEPNVLNFYSNDYSSVVQSITLPGFNIVDAKLTQPTFSAPAQLLIANSSGPSGRITFSGSVGALTHTFQTLDAAVLSADSVVRVSGGSSARHLWIIVSGDRARGYREVAPDQFVQTTDLLLDSAIAQLHALSSAVVVSLSDGGLQTMATGLYDMYVASFNPAGTQMLFGGYLGGTGSESTAETLDVLNDGRILVYGSSQDTEIVTIDGSLNSGLRDAISYELNYTADPDNDGISSLSDNCLNTANSDQIDADSDGFGNLCDGDFNNDCGTNFADFFLLANAFLTADPISDLNSDGAVNFLDVALFGELFLVPPGPSALAECP